MNLRLAPGLSLPVDAVTQKFAFLARSGVNEYQLRSVELAALFDRAIAKFNLVAPVSP